MNFAKILFFCALCCLAGCYRPVEGCLEIEATNYNTAADENCCCTYPNLVFEVEQFFDTLPYFPNRDYLFPSGEWAKIKAITFYLSDFQLFKNGDKLEVSDTMKFITFPDGNKETIKNDIQIIRRTPSTLKVGQFLPAGDFSNLKFSIGLNDPANRVQPAAAPINHPLRWQADSLWANASDGYRFLMVALARDTFTGTAVDTFYFTKKDFAPIQLDFSGNFSHPIGYDFNLKLIVNFYEWFRGLSLKNDNNQQLKAKVVDNLQKGFSVSQ